MISTQLDLFGGPPKPPKNIREEEPPIVTPPAEEKVVEPVIQLEPEISEELSDEQVLNVEKEPDPEEMPEWVDEPMQESDIEIEEEPTNESYQDVIDAPLDEYVPEIQDETQDEHENTEITFAEPISEIEDETESASEHVASEENESPLEVEDVQDNKQDAEQTFAAPISEDRVHVQLPSHIASPVVFTALIPVEDFVVEEEPVDEKEETQQEISDRLIEEDFELTGLGNETEEPDIQEEEPPPPPFMVEAITAGDVIIGGEPDVDVDDVNTEDAQETKEGQLQIPADEKLFLRQYYTMRETSNMFGVNQSLLRYWENEFDVLKPKKNRKGDRYFRPEDIKNLELIYHLLKVRKFTIEGAREYIKSKKKVLDTFELVQKLEKLKGFLHELKTHL